MNLDNIKDGQYKYLNGIKRRYSIYEKAFSIEKKGTIYQEVCWDESISKLDITEETEACLLYYLLINSNAERRIVFTNDWNGNCEAEDGSELYLVPMSQALALRPVNNSDRIHKVLHALSLCYEDFGELIFVGKEEKSLKGDLNKILFCKGTGEKTYSNMIDFLIRSKYLEEVHDETTNDGSFVMLSAYAWKIISQNEVANSNSIFVAMSYDNKYKKHEDTIKEAVDAAGYNNCIIKDKEHNNYIPEEIEVEIRNSVALIADLSGQNTGVYYEAGYAKACGLPVIFVCDKREQKKIHFDVKQINMIFIDDSQSMDHFCQILKRRIIHTVGRRQIPKSVI